MTSVITGDIINSRKVPNPETWMIPLKKLLLRVGKTPAVWEIYRGDSFQVEVAEPGQSFLRSLQIKACVKGIKNLDVRMSIGIGAKNYSAQKISESNGEAFINSGEMFDQLKKMKENMAVKTPWPDLDRELNLMISLAAIAMDSWTPVSAEMVALSLAYRHHSQTDLGKRLGRTQSSISERQTRAHYKEIMELERFYRSKIEDHLSA